MPNFNTPNVKIVISYNRFPSIKRKLLSEVDYIAEETGVDMQNHILEEMTAPKSGRMYGTHQASAPGEYPAVWFGELFDSITVKKTPRQVRLIVNAKHGVYLEYGTVHMAPRPFIAPAARWAKKRFVTLLQSLERRIK